MMSLITTMMTSVMDLICDDVDIVFDDDVSDVVNDGYVGVDVGDVVIMMTLVITTLMMSEFKLVMVPKH